MDWDDQDGPPDLVGTGVEVEAEEKPVKVPITIVTGLYPLTFFVSSGFILDRVLTGASCRIPRGWQNDTVELHSHCRTWKEDSRHHEW